MNWAILELYCGESGQLGYYNSQELGLARALTTKDIHVTIVYPNPKIGVEKIEETEEGISILQVPCKAFGVHAFYNLDFLLERKIDVVHLDSDNQIFAPGVMKFCRKHHIFFYNYIGTVYSDTENFWKKKFMDLISFRNIWFFKKSPVAVKTNLVKQILEEKGVKGIALIPVGLDMTQIKKEVREKADIRRELGLPLEKKILLFVGRLEPYKRPFAALDLLKKLGEAYHLVLIGTGSLKEEIKAEICKEKLEEQISCFERIPNVSMYQYYGAADHYVNFNTHEIFGMSILEAMYQGCTVIARKAPGPEEMIEDGISGYLCDSEEAMAAVIREGIQTGVAAEKRVCSYFTWKRSAECFLKLVKKYQKRDHEDAKKSYSNL